MFFPFVNHYLIFLIYVDKTIVQSKGVISIAIKTIDGYQHESFTKLWYQSEYSSKALIIFDYIFYFQPINPIISQQPNTYKIEKN